jgi:hypothetical protein
MSIILPKHDQSRALAWVKSTADLFLMPFIKPEQRAAFQSHVAKIEAYPGELEVHCEIQRDLAGTSMKIITTISPKRIKP